MVLSEDDDEFATDEENFQAGDGGDGGGIVLGNTSWGGKALEIAQRTLSTCEDLALYAFKASESGVVQVRLDKLTNEYGSPTLEEISAFNKSYGGLLEEAGRTGLLPSNLALEVSSPGAERVVQVPDDLSRFSDFPMQVLYVEEGEQEEAVLELDCFEIESQKTVWKLANVRLNRQALGKGRVFNKRQREWRLELPFSALKLVRLHVDV